MSHFGGSPADVVIDPVDRGPVTNAHILIYPEDPTKQASQQITALRAADGSVLPGYVLPNEGGEVEFETIDTYNRVFGQDPSGRVYRYDSWESRDLAAQAGEQFPAMQESVENAQQAAEDAQQAAENAVLGQLTVSIGTYATPGQLNGTEDATSAFNEAVANCPNGGRIIAPAGSMFWFDGSDFVELTGRHNLEFDLRGTACFKTTSGGHYNLFNVDGDGVGYGSGVRNLTIRNATLQGHYNGFRTGGASFCLLAANHAQGVRVYDSEFICCIISGHIIDLGGCDDILVRGCTFRGYNPPDGEVPRAEVVQADISRIGAGAGTPGNFDGLLTRNLRIEDCRFLPWTDPDTLVKYPAPNPCGSHAAREGNWYEDIRIRNVYVEDPMIDNATTGVNGDNPYIRGVFHFISVKGLTVHARVKATDGLGSIRVLMIASTSNGDLATSDPNVGANTGDFAVPVASEDIDADLYVEGMKGTGSTLNPVVSLTGASAAGGNIKGARIKLTLDGAYKEAVYCNKVEGTEIDFPKCANTETGARLIASNNVRVRGSFRNINLPVRVDNTQYVAVGPCTGQNTPAASNAFVTVSNGGDYVSVSGLVASGWSAGLYSVTPTHHAESAIVGPT